MFPICPKPELPTRTELIDIPSIHTVSSSRKRYMSNHVNARLIWNHSHGLSRLKLLAAQASMTRPQLKPFCLAFLKLMSQSGIFWAEYETEAGKLHASFRLGQLQSDIQGFVEVGIGNCYRLPDDFAPDLILDGGGNVGLFTLYALTKWPSAKAVIFEPVPDNLERIQTHLAANDLHADVKPFCLGSSDGTMTFYCREANQGSFSDDLPYTSSINVKVSSLRPYLPSDPRTKCLIKLDIEGAELAVMPDIIRQLSPNTLVVGELHHRVAEQASFRDGVIGAGRKVEFFDEGTCAMFHILTPASAPSMSTAS